MRPSSPSRSTSSARTAPGCTSTPPGTCRTCGSPIFSKTEFTSSNVPTQISDAVHRAQFGKTAKADWHTLLAPAVKPERTMTLPFGSYRFARNPDGSVAFVLININDFANRLFPATATDTTTLVGAA